MTRRDGMTVRTGSTAGCLFSYPAKGEKMKFTKIETQGNSYLVFSLGTLPKDAGSLARAACQKEGGDARGVLLLTPTLRADVHLDALDPLGRHTLSHEVFYALAAYLSYVAGLPIYEYEAETEEGIFPITIRRGNPLNFSVKRGKYKLCLSNAKIFAGQTEAKTDVVATPDGRYAVFFSHDAHAVDLSALAAACAASCEVRGDGLAVVSPAEKEVREIRPDGGDARVGEMRYTLRTVSQGEGAVKSPTAAACAALASLIARGRETYGRAITFCHDAGEVTCRLDRGGGGEGTSDARLLFRGEFADAPCEPDTP